MVHEHAIAFDGAVRAATGPRVAPESRIYAVGDIHGRYDLFLELMAHLCRDADARRDARRVEFVFLGDYIDRGEQSKDVLAALSRLAEISPERLVFLCGNHEEAMLAFLAAPEAGAQWLEFGGLQTLLSFGISPPRRGAGVSELYRVQRELSAALAPFRAFLAKLVPSYRSGDVVFTHAGLEPGRPLEAQARRALIWGHPGAEHPDPLPGLRVVHGHFDAAEAVVQRGRICVDTGAYYSNRLSAVRLDAAEAVLQTGSLPR